MKNILTEYNFFVGLVTLIISTLLLALVCYGIYVYTVEVFIPYPIESIIVLIGGGIIIFLICLVGHIVNNYLDKEAESEKIS